MPVAIASLRRLLPTARALDHRHLCGGGGGGGGSHHKGVLLRVEIGSLVLHDGIQQLRLKSLLLHGKVHDHDFGADLWGIVRR